ncbi:VWA domain-containing protein [Candidatus Fermentibacteria bacterium]|nr:VWA domain-containing protein [Candidatus Fermentibacteria bacterium]
MNRLPVRALLPLTLGLSVILACGDSYPPQSDEGLDLVVVFDTSGSMDDAVLDAAGGRSPKHVIGARALASVVARVEEYARPGSSHPRQVRSGLVVFRSGGAAEAVPFGPFDAAALRSWLHAGVTPRGSTPLGRSLEMAAQQVLASPLSRNHILVITDGMNTTGPDPKAVIPQIQSRAEALATAIGVHFIAFDIAAALFDELRQHDVTVVAAADEIQLSDQLSFIMEQKILLESEEPAQPDSFHTQ